MEEAAVHTVPVNLSECSAVGERQNGFGAELHGRGLEPCGNFVERFTPGDTLERLGSRAALGGDSAHGMKQAVRRVNTLKILGYFAAQKTARDGMIWIALDSSGASILNGDQDGTGVRAVMGTGGMNNARHVRL